MTNTAHWTERSTEDFLYSVATDFIEALKAKMQEIPMSQSKLASRAKVNRSYVSRIFKDPGNLSLETIIKFARIVGMKVSILAYEDKADPGNTRGPIDSEVFRLCWENAEMPADLWAVKEKSAAKTNLLLIDPLLANLNWGRDVYGQTNTGARPDFTNRVAAFPSHLIGAKGLALTKWDATLPMDWRK